MIHPHDRISAQLDGEVIVGEVLSVWPAEQAAVITTDTGVATIPFSAIVAVEPATITVRVRRADPAHPDELPVTVGLDGWELVAAIGAVIFTVAAGVVVAVGLIALAQHTYRWLT